MKRLLSIVLALIVFSADTKAALLEVSGVISAKSYRGSSTIYNVSNWFSVIIDGDNTQIKAGPMGDPAISYFEYGFLGTNSYTTIYYNTNFSVTEAFSIKDGQTIKTKLATPQKAINSASIYINNGRVPEYTLGMLSPVWLEYCFQFDLNTHKPNHILATPIFSEGSNFRENGGLADVGYALNSSAPNFLLKMTEVINRNQFEEVKLSSPVKTVFTNAIYQVLSWTNIADIVVPQHFCSTNFYIDDSAWTVYEGYATNMVFNIVGPNGFNIPLTTRVLERRSAVIKPLTHFSYTTTNGVLMSREKLEKYDRYRVEISEIPGRPLSLDSGTYARRRVVFFIVFGLLTLFPIYFVITKYINRTK